jgi:hypothetical protein
MFFPPDIAVRCNVLGNYHSVITSVITLLRQYGVDAVDSGVILCFIYTFFFFCQ